MWLCKCSCLLVPLFTSLLLTQAVAFGGKFGFFCFFFSVQFYHVDGSGVFWHHQNPLQTIEFKITPVWLKLRSKARQIKYRLCVMFPWLCICPSLLQLHSQSLDAEDEWSDAPKLPAL